MLGRVRRARAIAVTTLAGIAATLAVAAPADAASYVPISGSGSTAVQNVFDQWRRDVSSSVGQTVNYSGTGSTAGRNDFIRGVVDFATSELPFQTAPTDGSAPENPTRPYTYIPLVAGATSLAYNLGPDNSGLPPLQLSAATVAGIFTGRIIAWDDAAIAAENPGVALPDLAITPVVRSDGSGSTWQFTNWLATMQPQTWTTGATSLFPASLVPNGKTTSGSLGVAGYVSQNYGRGSITYVEYSYALQAGLNTVALRNASGAYVAPTAENVTTALAAARIGDDQIAVLDGVYTNPAPSAYPLSSYSYLIAPTELGGVFTESKGASLAAFADYAVCAGQQKATARGYAPLPASLVAAALAQIARIPGAGPASCAPAPAPAPTSGDIGIEAEVLMGVDAGLSLSTPVDETTELSPATTVNGQSVSTGTLPTFSVVEARVVSRPGYTVQTAVTDFTSGATTIPASSLEITPRVDAAGVASGVVAAARFAASATATDFAYAVDGAGVGTTVFGGDLTLTAPRGTPEGLYSARMTVTLVSR